MLVGQISKEIGFSQSEVLEIARRASHAYKIYMIKKRTGNGYRTISHPARDLKLLQQWLATRLLSVLPIHDCVYSYRSGVSVTHHAARHRNNNYLLRIDIKDFFPSISRQDVYSLLVENKDRYNPVLTDDDIDLVVKLACKGSAITIGAPSSPAISNAILYYFDSTCATRATELSATYTRYADDIFFSTNEPNILSGVLVEVRELLNRLPWPKLQINNAKTIFTSKKRRRVVTGLVLSSTNEVSIGRDKKRYVRSLLHNFILGTLSETDISYLKGYLSYAVSVEPKFLGALKAKYGEKPFADLAKLLPARRKA